MAKRGGAPEKSANGSERTKTRNRERQSIWSVSSTWGRAFFAIFSVLTLATSCIITAYLIANRGDAAIMEIYMQIAEKVFTNGAALGLTIYSITETMETAMVFANYLRQNLLEPLKERQREEGIEIGREEGIEIGIKIGREEGTAREREEGREEGIPRGSEEWIELGSLRTELKWRSWNERREKAEARGEPFDEPPPSFGG